MLEYSNSEELVVLNREEVLSYVYAVRHRTTTVVNSTIAMPSRPEKSKDWVVQEGSPNGVDSKGSGELLTTSPTR